MDISIRYFASLREIVGRNEETVSLRDGASVADVRTLLLERYPRLQPVMERSVYAVNKKYVPLETPLHDHDEVVFIPPMGGGDTITPFEREPLVQLTHEPLDRNALIEAMSHPAVGGIVLFEGVVRDHARGKQVRYLEYEAYEEMAEQQIRAIIDQAQQKYGEASVLIVVASPHRAEAFDACRYIIDTLKTTVPIWKKEVATNGEEWVEG